MSKLLARILDHYLIGFSVFYGSETEMKAHKGKKSRVKDVVMHLIQPTMAVAVATALLWLIASS